MREILFRGKRVDNGEWVEGDLTQDRDCGTAYIQGHDYYSSPEGLQRDEFCAQVDPSTIGQFTGLRDKNGVKIFEGDVVKTHYANAKKCEHTETVVFRGGKFMAEGQIGETGKCWAPLWDGPQHLAIDKSVYMDEVEVIGNIHDNPELLR